MNIRDVIDFSTGEWVAVWQPRSAPRRRRVKASTRCLSDWCATLPAANIVAQGERMSAEMAIVKKDATRKVAQGDMQFSMHQALQGGCPASRVTIFWSSREDKIAGRAPVRPTRIPAKKRRPLEWR